MATVLESSLREQLVQRKGRLATALGAAAAAGAYAELNALLSEVDGALERLESGTWGLCEVCHDPVEAERLACDPLLRYCLDHLTAAGRARPSSTTSTPRRGSRRRSSPPPTSPSTAGMSTTTTSRPGR